MADLAWHTFLAAAAGFLCAGTWASVGRMPPPRRALAVMLACVVIAFVVGTVSALGQVLWPGLLS